MPGWEVTRHPEWDLMYAAGITVREIADRAGRNRSTVHKHLEIREQYSPGLRATHDAARADREPGWPTPSWRQRLSELKDFVDTNGRGPEASVSPEESALHYWVVHQLDQDLTGTLHPAKTAGLNEAWPDWAGTE